MPSGNVDKVPTTRGSVPINKALFKVLNAVGDMAIPVTMKFFEPVKSRVSLVLCWFNVHLAEIFKTPSPNGMQVGSAAGDYYLARRGSAYRTTTARCRQHRHSSSGNGSIAHGRVNAMAGSSLAPRAS